MTEGEDSCSRNRRSTKIFCRYSSPCAGELRCQTFPSLSTFRVRVLARWSSSSNTITTARNHFRRGLTSLNSWRLICLRNKPNFWVAMDSNGASTCCSRQTDDVHPRRRPMEVLRGRRFERSTALLLVLFPSSWPSHMLSLHFAIALQQAFPLECTHHFFVARFRRRSVVAKNFTPSLPDEGQTLPKELMLKTATLIWSLELHVVSDVGPSFHGICSLMIHLMILHVEASGSHIHRSCVPEPATAGLSAHIVFWLLMAKGALCSVL